MTSSRRSRGTGDANDAPRGGTAAAAGHESSASETAHLVQRCKRGDERAFSELFARHRADVARIVYRMHGRRDDFEDLVQEAFVQIFRSISSFQGSARFSTWLYRVTVNVVLMHRRAARSRPALLPEDAAAPPPDPSAAPDEATATQRRIRAFRSIIDALSEKKRTVYVLHELEGIAPAEISQIVGAPVLTVRTRLFYARREVMTAMRKHATLSFIAADAHADSERPRRRE